MIIIKDERESCFYNRNSTRILLGWRYTKDWLLFVGNTIVLFFKDWNNIEALMEDLMNHSYQLPAQYDVELDASEVFSVGEIKRYRVLVGSGICCVTLGRLDLHFAVSTLASNIVL